MTDLTKMYSLAFPDIILCIRTLVIVNSFLHGKDGQEIIVSPFYRQHLCQDMAQVDVTIKFKIKNEVQCARAESTNKGVN